MRFHEFGTDRPDLLLVVQPRLVTWDLLLPDIQLLSERYHVLVPVMPGHDFQDGGEFSTVEHVADEIESWLAERGALTLCGAVGIDVGGSVILRLLADGKVRIGHAIIDAGVLPHQGSNLVSKLEATRDYLRFETVKHSQAMRTKLLRRHIHTREEAGIISGTMQRVTNRTVWNIAASCHSYQLPAEALGNASAVEYWCGSEELRHHRKDIRALKELIPSARIVELPQKRSLEFAVHHAPEYSSRIHLALQGA